MDWLTTTNIHTVFKGLTLYTLHSTTIYIIFLGLTFIISAFQHVLHHPDFRAHVAVNADQYLFEFTLNI